MSREASLHFQNDFTAAELAGRRGRVMREMGEGLAVVAAAPEVPGFDPIRQTNDFYYLTGVEVPHAYLTMNAADGRSVLYLPPRDAKHESSDGPSLSDEDGAFVASRTSIEEVRPIARLIDDVSNRPGTLWVMRAAAEGYRQCQDTLRHHARAIAADPLDGRPSRETHLLSRLATLSPRAEFRDLAAIVHRLRLIKSPAEAAVMRITGRLSAVAALEAMRATRVGVKEFQLGAIADYVFQVNGAQGAGYRPIIATADNVHMMHYWRNNTAARDGDWVLFDYAPDYHNYTNDIGRMFPANGRFSPVQRELYGFVLEYHELLLTLIRPGRMKHEILAEAAELARPNVERREWSKPIYKTSALRLLESTRPLSHGVGMPVHESASWAERPIEPGLVFAVDPELFIPEEDGYVRVEDTVLVTENGIENLTDGCPRDVATIERVMAEGRGGLLGAFPALHAEAVG